MTRTNDKLLATCTTCEVRVTFVDATKVGRTKSGKFSFAHATEGFSRTCTSLADAKGFITSVRKHAAHARTIALLTIAVCPVEDGTVNPHAVWAWAANAQL